MQLIKKRGLFFIAPIFLGLSSYFLAIGFEALNPQNLSWLQAGDPFYHYIGWDYYRHSSWTIPLGLNPRYGLDISSSIVYSDLIPGIAVIFKVFNNFLSCNFQYFGMWILLCFILQACLSWLLIGLFTKNFWLAFFGSALFVFSPIFLLRTDIQFAASSHFLILCAIYFNLRPLDTNRTLLWAALLSASICTNFYIAAICGILWASNLLDSCLHKKILPFDFIREALFISFIGILLAWQLGYFAVSSSFISTNEYGQSGINLLSWISPKNYSYVLINFAGANSTFEDFNYVGLGGLFLVFITLPFVFSVIKQKKMAFIRHAWFVSAVIVMAIFSLSNKISLGTLSFTFDPPMIVSYIGGLLRHVGRLFWAFQYCLLLFTLYVIFHSPLKKYCVPLIIFASILQITDTSAGWLKTKMLITESARTESIFEKYVSAFSNPVWPEFGGHYKNLIQIPIVQPPDGGNAQNQNLSFAQKYSMGTNASFLGRVDLTKLSHAKSKEINELITGKFSPDSLYIISDFYRIPVLMHLDQSSDLFVRIDNMNVLAPGWKNCSQCKKVDSHFEITDLIPETDINNEIHFSQGEKGVQYLNNIGSWPQLGYGWSFPEAFGTWSEGYQAKLVIPLPRSPVKALELEVRALIGPTQPKQSVEIWANGQFQRKIDLIQDQKNKLYIDIPETLFNQDYVMIELKLPNNISPKEIGQGEDTRKLAIGLIRGIWIP